MSVYAGPLFGVTPEERRRHGNRWRWPQAAHLLADTEPELHALAAAIGLRRAWAQKTGTWQAHYDLTPAMRQRALAAGALPLDRLAEGRLLRRLRLAELREGMSAALRAALNPTPATPATPVTPLTHAEPRATLPHEGSTTPPAATRGDTRGHSV